MFAKKQTKGFLVVLLAMALVMAAVACGQSNTTQGTETQGGEGQETASGKLPAPAKVMSAGSGGTGSLYVTYMATWTNLINSNFDTNVTVEPGGSSQNMQLIDGGVTEFGITSSSQAYQGYYGIGWAKGTKYQKVSALFPAYPAITAIFAKADKNINSIQDLNGKVVSLGVPASGSDVMGRQLFEFFNIKPKQIVNGSWEDTGGMVRDGLVDAVIYIGGNPAGFIQELETAHQLRFIALTPEEMKAFTKEYPYYGTSILPAGTYKGLKEDMETLAIWNFIIASSSLPEDFVYNLMKVTFDNVDQIRQAHSSFVDTDLKNAKFMTLPVHPGAAKYYQEKGIELPEVPAPPEAQ